MLLCGCVLSCAVACVCVCIKLGVFVCVCVFVVLLLHSGVALLLRCSMLYCCVLCHSVRLKGCCVGVLSCWCVWCGVVVF